MKWDMVKLGDICEIVSGFAFNSKLFSTSNTDTPLIRIRDVVRGYTETYTTEHVDEKYIAQKGDFLIGMDGEFNIAQWNSCTAAINQRVCKLVTNEQKCYGKYLFYFMPQALNDIEAKTSFVTVKHLSVKKLNEIDVPLPPLEEQKRIAAILDKAHSIRQKRQQNLENADALIKSIFLDMFGDPVANPKGWDKGTIRDVVKEVNYGTSKPANEQGKYVYLRMNNITYSGQLDLTSIKHIDVSDRDFIKYSVVKGDILFNRTNSKELVGKTCVFKSDTPMIIAGYIIRVRINEKANPDFLSATLNSAYGKSTLCGMCKSIIGQANINAQELQNIKTLIPPINLQNKFAEIVQKIEAQKAKQQEHLHEADQAFKALQQQFFG